MALPLIRALLGGLLKRSASTAAVKTGGRQAAKAAVGKPKPSGFLKAASKGKKPATIKPSPKMFQSSPSTGQYPPEPVWLSRSKAKAAKKQQATGAKPKQPPQVIGSPGAAAPQQRPQQGTAKTGMGMMQRAGNSISQLASKVAGMASQAPAASQPAPDTKKPKIDYSKMMGMMGQSDAKGQLEQEAAVKEEESRLIEEQSKSLSGQLGALGKSSLATVKSMFKMIGSVTGLGDASDAVSNVLKGDLVGAAKSGAKAFVKITLAVFALPLAVKKWTDSLVESRRELMIYNGRIAASIARLDVQKFQLGVRGAANTQASTIRLNKAIGELRESVQPMTEDLRTIVNTLAFVVVKVANGVSEITKMAASVIPMLGLLKTVVDLMEETDTEDLAGGSLEVALDALIRRGNQKPGPNPPMPGILP